MIDEAGARVKLRQTSLPEEISEVQKRHQVHRAPHGERGIANHEFEKARFYSDEERKERENLRVLREKDHLRVRDGRGQSRRYRGRGLALDRRAHHLDQGRGVTQKLLRIEEELHKRVISQDKSISALARAIRRSRAGLKNPNRPIGSFLFLGPTGVGKTEVARTLAQFMFGSETFADPLRYVRVHGEALGLEADRLASGIRRLRRRRPADRARKATPYSVVLLDEIEKAHPDVFNILLQVFEDGQLDRRRWATRSISRTRSSS